MGFGVITLQQLNEEPRAEFSLKCDLDLTGFGVTSWKLLLPYLDDLLYECV